MRQGPVRKRDFSDIDNLDRATASFMQEQRKLLEKFKPARAPHHQGFDPKKIVAYSATGITLAVIVGICVFAGINFGTRSNGMQLPPESSVSVSETKPAPAQTTTSAENSDSAASSVTDLPASSSKPSVTMPTTTASTAAENESPGTATTATTDRPASSQQSSKPSTSGSSQPSGGTSATKPTTPKQEVTQAPPPQTTPPAATKPPIITQAPVVTPPQQTTPPTQPPKQANLTVRDYTAADWSSCKIEKFSGMTEQTVTVHMSNTGNGDFSGKQQLSVKLSGAGKILHAACTTGQTSGSMTYSGDMLYFTFSGSVPAGTTVTVTMNIISAKPIWSTDI